MADYRYECVKVRVGDGIAWAALNRPEKRNAMSPTLHYEMDDALARLEVDDDAKVVVVTGEAGNFSAGQDLKTFFRELEKNPAERKKAAAAANRWRWERLYGFDKPTIAMVHGYCIGGAFMQLLACDFALAADDATFCLSEVKLGHLARCSRLEGCRRHGAPAPCALLRLPGRAVRRQGGRPHRHDQLCCPSGETRIGNRRAGAEANEEKCRQCCGPPSRLSVMSAPWMCRKRTIISPKRAKRYVSPTARTSYNTGLRQFLDEKSYKPTFEPFRLDPASERPPQSAKKKP